MRQALRFVCILLLMMVSANAALPARAQSAVAIPAGDTEALRAAINAAVQAGQPATISLAKGATYTFTAPDTSQVLIDGALHPRAEYASGADALPLITTAITINGNSAVFKRQGNAGFRFFTVFVSGNLTLQDLTLEGGDSPDEGGAIQDQTTGLLPGLTAIGVTFRSNRSANQGGALYTAGRIALTNCQFTGNQATRDGGAIYLSSGNLTVTGGTFQANATQAGTTNGGAIYVDEGARLEADGTQFIRNTAASGGAIAVSGAASIRRAAFSANRNMARGQVDAGGGAIYVGNYAQLTVGDSTFMDNHAENGGGAIGVTEGRSVTVTGSVFANNVADKASGAGAIVFLTTNATEQPTQASVTGNCFLNDSTLRDDGPIAEEIFISASFGGVVTLDATNNWWGSQNGPTAEQRGLSPRRSQNPSATFAYQPFLTAAPAFCSAGAPTALPGGSP